MWQHIPNRNTNYKIQDMKYKKQNTKKQYDVAVNLARIITSLSHCIPALIEFTANTKYEI